eukprot:5509165-Alexandrium_andersonii.AAC.1
MVIIVGKFLADFLCLPASTGLVDLSPRPTVEGPCPKVFKKLHVRSTAPSPVMICQLSGGGASILATAVACGSLILSEFSTNR